MLSQGRDFIENLIDCVIHKAFPRRMWQDRYIRFAYTITSRYPFRYIHDTLCRIAKIISLLSLNSFNPVILSANALTRFAS